MYQEAGDYEDQSSLDLYNMNPFEYHFETIKWDDMDEEQKKAAVNDEE